MSGDTERQRRQVAEYVHDTDRVDVFLFMTHRERVDWVADGLERSHPDIPRRLIDDELRARAWRWQRRPRPVASTVTVVGMIPAQPGDEVEVPDVLDREPVRHRVEAWAMLSNRKVAAVLDIDGTGPDVYDVAECITHRRPAPSRTYTKNTDQAVNGRRRLPPLTEVPT